MSDTFDFDRIIDREASNSYKYDARQHLFGRQDIIPMWVADMDFAVPPAVTEALTQRAQHPIYGYADYPDSLYQSIIDWFSKRHGWRIEREWIMMCPGVVPSIHATVQALLTPEQAMIIQPPVYHPFFATAKNTGRQLITNPLKLENGHYHIDFDHLSQCAKDASILLLCSPHNPVSRVWQQDELEQLLAIAQQHDLLIFSDEIHADITYPEHQHHVLAKLTPEQNIITAIAPSKTFNIAGLNLSALVVPDAKQRKAIQQAFNTLYISAANPFSITAFESAYQHGEAWLDAMLVYLNESKNVVADYLHQHLPQIKLTAPQGTYLLWLDCRDLKMDDKALNQFFVQEAKLGLSPGTLFGQAGSGFMRMNIAAPRPIIIEALKNINAALND